MQKGRRRAELEQKIGLEIGRELSARTILFHQALASLAGVTITDMKCLDYIDREAPVTAGDLARITGLTTGAITAAIDRLESAELAIRERSSEDRRKVYIRPKDSPLARRLGAIYEALAEDMQKLAASYSTRELETIYDYSVRCLEAMKRRTEAL